ncbi:hypothetical protein SBD_5018 [Streptomyces bottropensis ATCC 25435]|uniref:Uncharacterized protein n=1 Tax=Streptomyces bottropensis ATCC 25435 TaxID=1054862 RepID=M3FMZ5_9ACTN|nr:hypothetical protein SBD_5018 [Streptomyces bottropensis ATCC 25435]
MFLGCIVRALCERARFAAGPPMPQRKLTRDNIPAEWRELFAAHTPDGPPGQGTRRWPAARRPAFTDRTGRWTGCEELLGRRLVD